MRVSAFMYGCGRWNIWERMEEKGGLEKNGGEGEEEEKGETSYVLGMFNTPCYLYQF